jgi:hypothetical protein
MLDYNFTFEYFKTEQGYRMKCVCIHNNKRYQANQQKTTNNFDENKIKQDLIQYINGTT